MKEIAGHKQERHQQERDNRSESDERTGICTRCPWLKLVTVGNTVVPFKAFQMTPIASTVYTVQNQDLILEETPGGFNQNRVCGSLVRGGKKAENMPEHWPYLTPVNKNHTPGLLFTPLQGVGVLSSVRFGSGETIQLLHMCMQQRYPWSSQRVTFAQTPPSSHLAMTYCHYCYVQSTSIYVEKLAYLVLIM